MTTNRDGYCCDKCGMHGSGQPYSYLGQKTFCCKSCRDVYVAKTQATRSENAKQRSAAKERKVTSSSPPASKRSAGKSTVKVVRRTGGKSASLGRKLRKWFGMG